MEFQEGDAPTSSAKGSTNPLSPLLNDNAHSTEQRQNEGDSELAQASSAASPFTSVTPSEKNESFVFSEQSPEQVETSSACSIDPTRRNVNACHRTAKHPKYASEDARRATMANFPREKFQDVESLVAAGFFYDGYMDRVICFSCGGALFHWDEHDDPLIEHVRWYPDCAYVILCLGPQENAEISKRQQDVLETKDKEEHEVKEIDEVIARNIDSSCLEFYQKFNITQETFRKAVRMLLKKGIPIADIEKSHIEESLKEITRISKTDVKEKAVPPTASQPSSELRVVKALCCVICLFVLVFLLTQLLRPPSSQAKKACTSHTCLEAVAYMDSIVDHSIDPCEDFYGHVCHRWLNAEPPSSFIKELVSSFSSRRYELLENPPEKSDRVVAFASQFYASCLEFLRGHRNLYNDLQMLFQVTFRENTTTHLNGKTTHREAVAWRPNSRCGRNEMRAWYRYQRDRFCNTLTSRLQQIAKPGVRCICKYGYFRAQDRSCYPLRYCWSCRRRRNEQFSPCVSDCMKVCGEPDIQQCSMPCKIGCECKKGYIRKKRPNGPCVPIWTCPPKCGPSMEFRRYRPRCPRKCNNSRSSCSPENQGPGCACKRGYVLRADYGSIKSRASCVRETSCPKPRNQNNDYQIKTKG